MNEPLLPCPFCGDDQIERPENAHWFWTKCSLCECELAGADTREKADELWNRRALSQQPTLEPARPLDWNEGLCQNCRMPVHPTERSASRPEAAIEERADALRYRWLRAHAIEMGGFEFTVDDEAQEAIDSAIAASGFDAEARSGEKREVGKPESL